MSESRTANVKKNIIFGNISNILLLGLAFINRTVFISYLGIELLGISGLFSNILGILSFSELGIGSAMTFSLYKPIAENNSEKIKSLMQLYKTAYRVVALVISIIGLCLFPFLKYLLKTEIPIKDINFYYLIFLFNTVSSYFVTYKTSYVTALQKNYIVTNTTAIGHIVTYSLQLISIIIFKNYFIYLIIQCIALLLQKIFTVFYINKKFPVLVEKNIKPVDIETKKEIKKNIKALIIHKIGDASVHQTDNIIISYFINTITVGLISNYVLIQNTISKFTKVIFNSFTASLGNLIATENIEKQEEILNQYIFIGFWIYGFITTCLISLSQPLFIIWGRITGKNMLIDDVTMILYYITIYLGGQSLTLHNFKIAAGIFDDDKWVALVQAIVNLVTSIIAIKIIGLPGVYVGTIIQRIVCIIWKPIIVYKKQFNKSPIHYFITFIYYIITTTISIIINKILINIFFREINILTFLLLSIFTCILTNIVFLLIHYHDKEFKSLMKKIIKHG